MINQILAVKIIRHDFGNNNSVSSMGFFPGKQIIHNKEKFILRQGDTYRLSFEDKTDKFYVIKFIHKEGFFEKPLLVDLEDIILNDKALLSKNVGFELLETSHSIEYIGNFIEDDIPTIFNIISNYQERFRENEIFKGLLNDDKFFNYFYNYFDKSIQGMVFHLSFNDAVFMFKDFEKIILESSKTSSIVKNLNLRYINFFPIYPLYSLYEYFDGNRMPAFTAINSLLNVNNELFLTLLDDYGRLKIYDVQNKKIIYFVELKNKVINYVVDNKILNEKESKIINIYFSNNSPEYIYAIQDINFEKIHQLIK